MRDQFVCLSHLSGPRKIVGGSLRVAMLTMGSNDVSPDQRPAPSDMRGRIMRRGWGEVNRRYGFSKFAVAFDGKSLDHFAILSSYYSASAEGGATEIDVNIIGLPSSNGIADNDEPVDDDAGNNDDIDISIEKKTVKPRVVFFSNVYPDPSASAAGVRTQFFLEQMSSSSLPSSSSVPPNDNRNLLFQSVQFATASSSSKSKSFPSPNKKKTVNRRNEAARRATYRRNKEIQDNLLEKYNVPIVSVPPNDSEAMANFCSSLFLGSSPAKEHFHPPSDLLVIFDRFYSEEAYSFSIREQMRQRCSNVNVDIEDSTPTLVLDMQDMHSLRWGRQQVVQQFDKKQAMTNNSSDMDPLECLNEVMEYRPTASNNPHLLRELASIHRCDMTWVCSPYEMKLLNQTYQIPESKLTLASFYVEQLQAPLSSLEQDVGLSNIEEAMTTDQQENGVEFVFCGGFRHAPNVDAVHVLLEHIWPRIRKQLPASTLHIHGAFCPSSILSQDDASRGVHIHGYTESLDEVFSFAPQSKKILLAPLRFGAGIKGKIVDAWRYGMPVVTTPVGSEGMTMASGLSKESRGYEGQKLFGGLIASNLHEFCEMAISVAGDPELYQEKQIEATQVLTELYGHDSSSPEGTRRWNLVLRRLENKMENIDSFRESDFVRSLLWHQTARSTEYFSRWIELKDTMKRGGAPPLSGG